MRFRPHCSQGSFPPFEFKHLLAPLQLDHLRACLLASQSGPYFDRRVLDREQVVSLQNERHWILQDLTDGISQKLRSFKYTWSSGHGSLPSGWQMRAVESNNDKGTRFYFLSPEGVTYYSVVTTLEQMIKKRYSVRDITTFVRSYGENGKENAIDAALQFMKELGGYSMDDAKKFRIEVASQEEKSWKENNGFIH